jgi:hypothetical protein
MIFDLDNLRNVKLTLTTKDSTNLRGYKLIYKIDAFINNKKQGIMEEKSLVFQSNKITFLVINLTSNVERL